MAKGIMLVESSPSSADEIGEFHRWYNDVHMPEILSLDGFISGRRLASLDGESFVAVYEVNDINQAKDVLAAAQASGSMTRPTGVRLNPPPSVQWFEDSTH
jgi:hypothetical protein